MKTRLKSLIGLEACLLIVSTGCGGEKRPTTDLPRPQDYSNSNAEGYSIQVKMAGGPNLTASEMYVLKVTMRWESSTGNIEDLKNCEVREVVTRVSSSSPFIVPREAAQEGKVASGEQGHDNIPDFHGWSRFLMTEQLVSGSMIHRQTVQYKFKDEKADQWKDFAEYRIKREVVFLGGRWFFKVTKERLDKPGESWTFAMPITQVQVPTDWPRNYDRR